MAIGKQHTSWFDVDRKGLALLVSSKPKTWILYELIQNVLDCPNATFAEVTMEPVEGRPQVKLTVVDDEPEGFKDLAHSYTIFAASEKKSDPGRRGRFNFGEKLVLSLCESASISSTTGTVTFGPEGRRVNRKRKRPAGTCFEAIVRMTREECQEALREIRRVLVSQHVAVTVNGVPIPVRPRFHSFVAVLPTVRSDSEGVLRTISRETAVDLYLPNDGEEPTLYEMGIPVVTLKEGVPWHIDVLQKIPLTLDRDNVPPSYLGKLHTHLLNKSFYKLTSEQVKEPWVLAAMASSQVEAEAVRDVVVKRFGDRAVIADPSDREGEHIAVARGYTVVAGGTFPAPVWSNIKSADALRPAGKVTPSPKPFSPEGKPLKLIPLDEWTSPMLDFALWFRTFASEVAQLNATIQFTKDRSWKFNAAHTHGEDQAPNCEVIFNLGLLGEAWLTPANWQAHVRLSIHELAHQWGHHLESGYHEALCWMAARAVVLALARRDLFNGV